MLKNDSVWEIRPSETPQDHTQTAVAPIPATPARKGDWLSTYTGLDFYPLDPREEEVSFYDICHALSLKSRFNGHCSEFISVAEHSVTVARIILDLTGDYALALLGFFHDGGEAYVPDVPRPLKPDLTGFKEIEDAILEVVLRRAKRWTKGLLDHQGPLPKIVKLADDISLACEADRLISPKSFQRWKLQAKPDPRYAPALLLPEEASHYFWHAYKALCEKRPIPTVHEALADFDKPRISRKLVSVGGSATTLPIVLCRYQLPIANPKLVHLIVHPPEGDIPSMVSLDPKTVLATYGRQAFVELVPEIDPNSLI